VKAIQATRGSRASYARQEERGGFRTDIDAMLTAFLAEVDTAYLATTSAAGQPYAQHRGGPRGFIRALDARTLAFADYSGNRQYISTGNLAENDKAFLFLMDYAHRRRIKLWGRARVVENDPDLLTRLTPAFNYPQLPRPLAFARRESRVIPCPAPIRERCDGRRSYCVA
jgi:predicted pyridoxine 5'-phosphate oxidase superfamily flavin-nucleotide-binding protein